MQKAQREEASVAHRGVYSFKVDACEALNPYDRDVAHWPDLISVATTNSVQLPLSEDTQASLGCKSIGSVVKAPSCKDVSGDQGFRTKWAKRVLDLPGWIYFQGGRCIEPVLGGL